MVKAMPWMLGGALIRTLRAARGSHSARQLVGASGIVSVLYTSARLSKVRAGPNAPATLARGSICARFGTLSGGSAVNRPSAMPGRATITSMIATSICGLSFWARRVPSRSAEVRCGK
jgi:hypothetical protein